MILSTRLKNKKSGTRRPLASSSIEAQELGDHVLSGHQTTSYDKSDRWSSATTDWDSIDDYLIIQVSP
jgi:hypothetical protein